MTVNVRNSAMPLLGALLVVIITAGCSSIDPFGFDDPPAASSRLKYQSVEGEHTVIVVGELDNPGSASVRWRDIGSGVTEAIVRELRNEKRYAVRSDRRLGSEIAQSLVRSASDRIRRLERFREKYPDVDYVVIGEVTDFHHSADLPKSARQRSIFGEKHEAIVAVRLTVVDIASGTVVLDDHITATARAGDEQISSRDRYRNIEFGSYVFWNTPFGEATRDIVERAADRIDDAVPLLQGQPMIVRLTDTRRVELNAGRNMGLMVGQQYFVCATDPETGKFVALRDVDTGQPILAKVLSVSRDDARAWLIGRAAVSQPVRGTRLLRVKPKDPEPAIDDRSENEVDLASSSRPEANTTVDLTQADDSSR